MVKINRTISNILILISIIVTMLTIPYPGLLIYGMNGYFIFLKDYISFGIQFMLYQFLHGSILHILGNSIFLLIFGNQVEIILGTKKYFIFFLLNTVFTGFALLFFASGNTIGISGFAMAVLGFLFMELRKMKHPDYRGAGTFLVINVLIGFSSDISLVGHLAGAIFGIIYFYLLNIRLNKIK